MDNSQLLAGLSLTIAVISTIIGVINHKKLKSKCCGRTAEISIDIENSTPVERIRRSSFIVNPNIDGTKTIPPSNNN